MSRTIDLTDASVQEKIQDLRRKNESQRMALENMASQLDVTCGKALDLKLDALKEESILYVRDYFDQLKKGFTDYCKEIVEHMVMSPAFTSIYKQVMDDKKLLDDIQSDINRFSRHFVLKDSFDNYVSRIERTHQKYTDFSRSQLIPEVRLARDEDFFKNLQILLKEGVRFENNLVEYTSGLKKDIADGPGLPRKEGDTIMDERLLANTDLGKVLASKESPSYEINFLHYFQEGSKKVHFMNLDRKVMVWETIDLDIGFEIPLFSSTLAARRDVVMLAGGIENARKTTQGNVYIFNMPTKSLLKVGEMIEARNNFAMVRLKDKIYAVGGCNDKNGKLRSCESVNLIHEDFDTGQSESSRRPVDPNGPSEVPLLEPLSCAIPRPVHHQVWRVV